MFYEIAGENYNLSYVVKYERLVDQLKPYYCWCEAEPEQLGIFGSKNPKWGYVSAIEEGWYYRRYSYYNNEFRKVTKEEAHYDDTYIEVKFIGSKYSQIWHLNSKEEVDDLIKKIEASQIKDVPPEIARVP